MAGGKSGAGKIEAAATITWSGWGGEVTGESGRLKAKTATQAELGGPGQATNPEELLAAALANCYTSTITAHARAKKIDLASLESLHGRRQFRPFFEQQSVDVAIIDVAWNGILESMKIAAMVFAPSYCRISSISSRQSRVNVASLSPSR